MLGETPPRLSASTLSDSNLSQRSLQFGKEAQIERQSALRLEKQQQQAKAASIVSKKVTPLAQHHHHTQQQQLALSSPQNLYQSHSQAHPQGDEIPIPRTFVKSTISEDMTKSERNMKNRLCAILEQKVGPCAKRVRLK